MNIFVTDPDPNLSAEVLPDKHVVKMPLETCQMLAVVYSKWYFNWGNDLLPKKDGTPYNTEKGAFRGHPCTCLLYTSPSPRDKRQSRMPSSA